MFLRNLALIPSDNNGVFFLCASSDLGVNVIRHKKKLVFLHFQCLGTVYGTLELFWLTSWLEFLCEPTPLGPGAFFWWGSSLITFSREIGLFKLYICNVFSFGNMYFPRKLPVSFPFSNLLV